MLKNEKTKQAKKLERMIENHNSTINYYQRKKKELEESNFESYKEKRNLSYDPTGARKFDDDELRKWYDEMIERETHYLKFSRRDAVKAEKKKAILEKELEELRIEIDAEDKANPFRFSDKKLPEKFKTESLMDYCKREGFERMELRGVIGNGDKTHVLICYCRKENDGLMVARADSYCGSQKWMPGKGYSGLYLVDDRVDLVNCLKCK